MDSGYPAEWFVEEIEDYLKCGVCSKVLRNPRATSCGHVYCKHCINSWIEYYGVCPNRCGDLDHQQLAKAVHIEKRISGLLTRCKYCRSGCSVQVPLTEKHKHEKNCPFRAGLGDIRKTISLEDTEHLPFRFRVRHHPAAARRPSNVSNKSAPAIMNPRMTQHVFRVKRNRPKEPLGLVMVSGEKTPDGRTENFYVKQVNRDTLAWKAGIQAGDRITQVDNYDLCHISKAESVARIKDKTVVTLTVIRGGGPLAEPPPSPAGKPDDHIYDEILYADLSQPVDENFPPYIPMAQKEFFQHQAMQLRARRSHRPPMHEEQIHGSRSRIQRPVSPATNFAYKAPSMQTDSSKGIYSERGSKDSGLSSGSGESPPIQCSRHPVRPYPGYVWDLDHGLVARQPYRAEREVSTKEPKGQDSERVPSSSRCRIEGDYEVEEIYLQKNGTSQLGLTLGYDTRSGGHLFVCEILPDGLAYQDGRVHLGDLVQRVNGFEVYDPEEAILLFLEQDQDITLTVARKIKFNDHSSDYNMDTVETNVRRIDSCGSLDSHAPKDNSSPVHLHDSQRLLPMSRCRALSQDNLLSNDSTDYGEAFRRRAASFGKSRLPPRQEALSQPQPSLLSPDYSFRPIPPSNRRPRTAGRQRVREDIDSRRRVQFNARVGSPTSAARVVPTTFHSSAGDRSQLSSKCDSFSKSSCSRNERLESLV